MLAIWIFYDYFDYWINNAYDVYAFFVCVCVNAEHLKGATENILSFVLIRFYTGNVVLVCNAMYIEKMKKKIEFNMLGIMAMPLQTKDRKMNVFCLILT